MARPGYRTLGDQLREWGIELQNPATRVLGGLSLPVAPGPPAPGVPLSPLQRLTVEAYQRGAQSDTPLLFGWQLPVRTAIGELPAYVRGRYAAELLVGLSNAANLPQLIANRPLVLLDVETIGPLSPAQAILTEVAVSGYRASDMASLSQALGREAADFRMGWVVRPTQAQQARIARILDKAQRGMPLKQSERMILAQLARYSGATVQASSPSLMALQLQQAAVERARVLMRTGVFTTADLAMAQQGLAFLVTHGVDLHDVAQQLAALHAQKPLFAGLNVRLFDLPVLRHALRGTAAATLFERAEALDLLELASLIGPEEVHRTLLAQGGRRIRSRAGLLRHLARLPASPLSQEALLFSLDPTRQVQHTALADIGTTARITGALLPSLHEAATHVMGGPFWMTPSGIPSDELGTLIRQPRLMAQATGGWVTPTRTVHARHLAFVLEESTGQAMYHKGTEPLVLLSADYVYEASLPFVVTDEQGRPRAVAMAFRSPELRRTSFILEPIHHRVMRERGEQAAIEEASARLRSLVATWGVVPLGEGVDPSAFAGMVQESLEDRARRLYQRLFEIDRARNSGVRLLRQLTLANQLMQQAGDDVQKAWALLSEAVRQGQLTHAVAIDAMTLLRPGTRLTSELPYLLGFMERYGSRFATEAEATLALRRFHRLLQQHVFQEPDQIMRPLRAGEMQVLLPVAGRSHWLPLRSAGSFASHLERVMEPYILPNATEAQQAASRLTLLQQMIDDLHRMQIRVGRRRYTAITAQERRLLIEAARSATDPTVAFRNQAQLLYTILEQRLAAPGPEVMVGGVTAPVYYHLLAGGGQVPALSMAPRTLRPGVGAEQIAALEEQAFQFVEQLIDQPQDPLVRRALAVVESIQAGRTRRDMVRRLAQGARVTGQPVSALAWSMTAPGTGMTRHFITLYPASMASQVLGALEQEGMPPLGSRRIITLEIPTIEELGTVPVGDGRQLTIRAVRYGGQVRLLPQAIVDATGRVRTAQAIMEETIQQELESLVRALSSKRATADPTQIAARIRRRFGTLVSQLAGMDALDPAEAAKLARGIGTLGAARRGLLIDFSQWLAAKAAQLQEDRTAVGPRARIAAAEEAVSAIPALLRTQGFADLAEAVERYGIWGLKDDELTHGRLAAFDPRILMPFGEHYSPTHPNVTQFLTHYLFDPEELRRRLPSGLGLRLGVPLVTAPYAQWLDVLGQGRIGTVGVMAAIASNEDLMARIRQLAETPGPDQAFWRSILQSGSLPLPYESAIFLASELQGAMPGAMPLTKQIPLDRPGVELHPTIRRWLEAGAQQPLVIEPGQLPYLYERGGRAYGALPDRRVVLHGAYRDPTTGALVLQGIAEYPLEPGAKVLLGTGKGAAYFALSQRQLEQLTGLPGVAAVYVAKSRDLGNVAWGMLNAYFAEASAYMDDAGRRVKLAQLFQKYFGVPLTITPVTIAGERTYRFVIPGQRAPGELVGLGERPLETVQRFLRAAERQLGIPVPSGLLDIPEGGAMRVLLPLVRAQVQETLKYRSAFGLGPGGWQIHPQELTAIAQWQGMYGVAPSRLLGYLQDVAGVSVHPHRRSYYEAVRNLAEAWVAMTQGAAPPADLVVDAAELWALPSLVQRRGGLSPEAIESSIVGRRPGRRLTLQEGQLWYLRLPERLGERPGASGGLFTIPGLGDVTPGYVPIAYVPMPEGTQEGVFGRDIHRAYLRIQHAAERILRLQAQGAEMEAGQYAAAAQRANEAMERALASYYDVVRRAFAVKPKAGGFALAMLESFTAPSSGYFITAPLVPDLADINRVIAELAQPYSRAADRIAHRVLIDPDTFAQRLLGEGATWDTLERIARGEDVPLPFRLGPEDRATLRTIVQQARRGELHVLVGRNPVVAGTSIHVARLQVALTDAQRRMLGGRAMALDPIMAALSYADFDQDQIFMLVPWTPKLKWTQQQYLQLQEELARIRRAQVQANRYAAVRILHNLREEAEATRGILTAQAVRRALEVEDVITTRLIKDATTGRLYNQLQRMRQWSWALWGETVSGIEAPVQQLRSDILGLIEGLSHLAQEEMSIKAGKHGARAGEQLGALELVDRVIRAVSAAPYGEVPQEAVEYLAGFLMDRPDYLIRYRHLIEPLATMGPDEIARLAYQLAQGTADENLRRAAAHQLANRMIGAAVLTRHVMEQMNLSEFMESAAARRGFTQELPKTLEDLLSAVRIEQQELPTLESLMAAAQLSPEMAQRLRDRLTSLREMAAQKLHGILNPGYRPGEPMEVLARATGVSLDLANMGGGAASAPMRQAVAQAAQQTATRRGASMARGLTGASWMRVAGIGAALAALGYITYRRSAEPLEVAGVPEAPGLFSPTVRIAPQDPRGGGIDVRILARRNRDIPAIRLGDAVGQAISSSARIPVDVQITQRYDDERIDEQRLQQEIARLIRMGV